jgi:hypothetical protein
MCCLKRGANFDLAKLFEMQVGMEEEEGRTSYTTRFCACLVASNCLIDASATAEELYEWASINDLRQYRKGRR